MSSNETPRGPVDSSRIPRYAGPATYARLPRLDEVGTRRRRRGRGAVRRRCLVPAGRALRRQRDPRGVPAAASLQPGAGRVPVRAGAGRGRRRHRGEPVQHQRGRRDHRGRGGRTPRHRRAVDDPGRRPHHRAPAAALGREEARPGRPAALRRPSRHLGHVLRRRVHARDAVPPGGRGGHPRHGGALARRHPRAAVRQAGPHGRREDGLRHRHVGGRLPAGRRRGRRPAAPAHRRPAPLHLHRHRLPRPGPRARHRHARRPAA